MAAASPAAAGASPGGLIPAADATAQFPAATQFQPGSAPVPAPGADAPVSAPAYNAYATAQYGQPAPKKKRGGVIALSVATGVLALATIGLGVLYFLESQARTKADTELTQRTAALVAEEAKSKNLDSQLKASKEEVAKLNQDLTGAKAKTDEVTKARDALIGCFQAIEAFDAKQNAENAKQVIIKCEEADKYL